MEAINILIVDGQPLFREALQALLERHQDVRVVGEAPTARDGVDAVVQLHPDVVILDLPTPLNGTIAAISEMREASSQTTGVLALGTDEHHESVIEVLRAGANGFLPKGQTGAALIEAVRTVAAGGTSLDYGLYSVVLAEYRRLALAVAAGAFSRRDLTMLEMLAHGATNPEIADRLALSRQTVKNLLSDLYARLGVANRGEAVAAARARGLIWRPVDWFSGMLNSDAVL